VVFPARGLIGFITVKSERLRPVPAAESKAGTALERPTLHWEGFGFCFCAGRVREGR